MQNQIKKTFKKIIVISSTILLVAPLAVNAQPYGQGKFGDDVPYGSQTTLSISTGGDVSIQVTPDDNAVLGSADNTVTVTSTDVVGYKLYIRALTSTDMTNGGATIPASANMAPAALAANTWGYNVNGSSTNFTGVSLSDTLIKDALGPYSSGDNTTVKYGIKIDNAKPAGNYSTTIMYTAAPQTD